MDGDAAGRLVMRIEHAPLTGLTPADLMSRYLAWHPSDHIHWALHRPGPNGWAERGAVFHIVEAFGGDMRHLIDVTETVTRLDLSGITLEKRIAGQRITQLSHDFGQSAAGATYRSTLTVGLETAGLRRLANPFLQRLVFSPAMGRAWIKHNVEEVGLLEHLVPLVREQAAAGP